MIRELGHYPDVCSEVEDVYANLLVKKKIVTQLSDTTYSLWPHLCGMNSNITIQEYEDCVNADPGSAVITLS